MYHRQQNTPYPQKCQILRRDFLRYLDLSYVNPTYHKLKTFPHYYWLSTNQKVQEIVFAKSATFVQ